MNNFIIARTSRITLWLLALAALIAPAGAHGQGLTLQTAAEPVPMVDDVAGWWGGHTFPYVLQGKGAVFWSAVANDGTRRIPTAIVGRHPLPGSGLAAQRHEFPYPPDTWAIAEPIMVRTPDGIIHIFIGIYEGASPNQVGRMKYFRTTRPDDLSEIVDRTSLIPDDIDAYHVRTSFGLSADGERLAWVILTVQTNGYAFNTPIIYMGRREGLDFVFDPGVPYAPSQSLFYPQVAVTDDGIVMTYQDHGGFDPVDNPRTHWVLIHLDNDLNLLRKTDFETGRDGHRLVHDMQPRTPGDRSRLILAEIDTPLGSGQAYHRLLEYDTRTRTLSVLKEIATTAIYSNPTKWLRIDEDASFLVNNVASANTCVWKGELLGGGGHAFSLFDGGNPYAMGYPFSTYVSRPCPLVGSLATPGETHFVVCSANSLNHDGPFSLMLVRATSPRLDTDGDGRSDAQEALDGTDPLDPADFRRNAARRWLMYE